MKGVRSRITDGDVSSQSNVFVSCCLYVGHQFICVMLFVSRRPIYLCKFVCKSDTNLFVLTLLGFMANGWLGGGCGGMNIICGSGV